MRRLTFLLTGFIVSMLWFGSAALALDQPTYGGNNSSDYQPPTGNPQTNIPGALQPTNTALQPVTNLDQQALIQTGALSVLTAPDKGATSTAREAVVAPKTKTAMPVWIIGGLLTLVAVLYVLFRPDQKPAVTTVAGSATLARKESVATEKPKKQPKKTAKKIKTSKKKSARK